MNNIFTSTSLLISFSVERIAMFDRSTHLVNSSLSLFVDDAITASCDFFSL